MDRAERITRLFQLTLDELLERLADEGKHGLGIDSVERDSVDRFASTAMRRLEQLSDPKDFVSVISLLSDHDLPGEFPEMSAKGEEARELYSTAALHRARFLATTFAQRSDSWYADWSGAGEHELESREIRNRERATTAAEKLATAVDDLASVRFATGRAVAAVEPKLTRCIKLLLKLADARLAEDELSPSSAVAAMREVHAIAKGFEARAVATEGEIASVNACIACFNESERSPDNAEHRKQLVDDLKAFNRARNVAAVFNKEESAIALGVEVGVTYDKPSEKYPAGRFSTRETRPRDGTRRMVKLTDFLPIKFVRR